MFMDVIHFSIEPVNASLTTAAAPLLGLIGYVAGELTFGGVEIHAPHSKDDIAHFEAFGANAADLVSFVETLNVAEMKKNSPDYQMRGGRRQKDPSTGEVIYVERSQGPVLARHINFALPFGVPAETRIAIAREFAEFVRAHLGAAVILGVHNKLNVVANDGHLVVSERAVGADGKVGAKIRALNGIASTARGSATTDSTCETMRATYAAICNRHLDAIGAAKVFHESYARRGIAKIPQQKRNRAKEKRAARIGGKEVAVAPFVPAMGHALRQMRQLRQQRQLAAQQAICDATPAYNPTVLSPSAEIVRPQTVVADQAPKVAAPASKPNPMPPQVSIARAAVGPSIEAPGQTRLTIESVTAINIAPAVAAAMATKEPDAAFFARADLFYAVQAIDILAMPTSAKIDDAKMLVRMIEKLPEDQSPLQKQWLEDWLASHLQDLKKKALEKRDRRDRLFTTPPSRAMPVRSQNVKAPPRTIAEATPKHANPNIAAAGNSSPPVQPGVANALHEAQAGRGSSPSNDQPVPRATPNAIERAATSATPTDAKKPNGPVGPPAAASNVASSVSSPPSSAPVSAPEAMEETEAAQPVTATATEKFAHPSPELGPTADRGQIGKPSRHPQPPIGASESKAPAAAQSPDVETLSGSEPTIAAFHPRQLTEREQRMFRALVVPKLDLGLAGKIRHALGAVIEKLEAWWKAATKEERTEFRSIPAPGRKQIAADLQACHANLAGKDPRSISQS
jgi:hypothetical protein